MRLSLGRPTKEIGFVEIENDCLELIGVWPDFRNQGHSLELIQKTLEWMKENKKSSLWFLASNFSFWEALQRKFPKNIFLYPSGEGEIFYHEN